MTFLPIVERELRVAARRPLTYWMRVAMVAVALVLAMVTFLVFSTNPVMGAGFAGKAVFGALSGLAMLYCAVEGVRQTSDCLSGEKREGTLGLLFLTDLRGHDVVLGKFAAAALNAFYGLFAAAPVLALPLLLGGVTQGEYWRMVMALVNSLFVSLALGVWVSSRSREEARALFGALGLMGMLCVGLPWLETVLVQDDPGLMLVSPLGPFMLAFEGAYFTDAWHFWAGLVAQHALGWALLVLAGKGIERHWRGGDRNRGKAEARAQRWWRGNARQRAGARKELLDRNPVHWLSVRRCASVRWYAIAVALIVVAYVCSLAGQIDWTVIAMDYGKFVGWTFFFAKIYAAWAGCRVVVEARHSGALELLLSTPLRVEQIVWGQWKGLRRFWWALVYLAILFPAVLLVRMWVDEDGVRQAQFLSFGMSAVAMFDGFEWLEVLVPVIGGGVTSLADVYALFWVGMWLGLCSGRLARAFFQTCALVIFIPWFALTMAQIALMVTGFVMHFAGWDADELIQFLLVVLVLAKDFVFIVWARRNLHGRFREVASSERRSSQGGWAAKLIPKRRPAAPPPMPG